jgi:hypothetical protein
MKSLNKGQKWTAAKTNCLIKSKTPPFTLCTFFLTNEGKLFLKHRIGIVFAARHNPSISSVGYKFRVVF